LGLKSVSKELVSGSIRNQFYHRSSNLKFQTNTHGKVANKYYQRVTIGKIPILDVFLLLSEIIPLF